MAWEHATWFIRIILALAFGMLIIYIRKAKSGYPFFIRRIAGVDAIEDAVGRAAELGRPVSFTTGLAGIGPVLYACLGALHHVVAKAATYRNKVLLPQSNAEVMAVVDDVARDAYRSVGRLSSYDPQSNIYLSDEQFAYTAGYAGLIQREKVASTFLFGEFAAESLILAEAGRQVDAMQVAATINPDQIAFFVVTCDYTLIGEELFATSAYLTREPIQLGSLVAQDRLKLCFMILIALGVFFATWNVCFPELSFPFKQILFEDYSLFKDFFGISS